MAEAGRFTDDRGRACCRFCGKRCLTYTQAKAAQRAARKRGEAANIYPCRPCCAWHWGHQQHAPTRKPRRRWARRRPVH